MKNTYKILWFWIQNYRKNSAYRREIKYMYYIKYIYIHTPIYILFYYYYLKSNWTLCIPRSNIKAKVKNIFYYSDVVKLVKYWNKMECDDTRMLKPV